MAKEYPKIQPGAGLILAWQLKGKKVLLVGGGPVAAGRLVNVKDADAVVTVMAPRSGLCAEMKYRIFEEHAVDRYLDREFGGEHDLDDADESEGGDGKGYDMVLTAIDDVDVSRSICQWARKRRIPVNVADVPPECDFYFGSLVRRGPLQVMISTGGKGPRIAAQTREVVERALPPNIALAIEKVGQLRALLRKRAPDAQVGRKRMAWMIDVCETWSWDQLANMDEADMRALLEDFEAGGVKSAWRVKGVRRAMPDKRQLRQRVLGKCPVVGAISPWLSGVGGFCLGAAAAFAVVSLRTGMATSAR